MYQGYETYSEPTKRSCRIYSNGQQQQGYVKVYLYPGISLREICKKLQRIWNFSTDLLRLFTNEGVEMFQEDLMFIKDRSNLYASLGEEFDTRTTFLEYEIISQLGEGGFGQVLLGQHKITDQKVAIKIVNTQMIGNAQVFQPQKIKDIDMVFREAELLKSLEHRNIVRIYNCCTLPNMQVVFIMEYLEGGELLEYVESCGCLSEEEARIFFVQIAEAISYCHMRKLIHRDLKLENILLANKHQRIVKIVDFGIAGVANNLSVDKIDAGSLRYMAPESLSGSHQTIGSSIDIWALGVILYTMVYGQLPFDGKDNQEVTKKILTSQYSFPGNISCSQELKDLISRIFIVDDLKRIKLKDILSHEWIKRYIDAGSGINQIGSDPPDLIKGNIKKVRLGQVTRFGIPSALQAGPTQKRPGGLKKEPTKISLIPSESLFSTSVHVDVDEQNYSNKPKSIFGKRHSISTMPDETSAQSPSQDSFAIFSKHPRSFLFRNSPTQIPTQKFFPHIKSIARQKQSPTRAIIFKEDKIAQWKQYTNENKIFIFQQRRIQKLEQMQKLRSLVSVHVI